MDDTVCRAFFSRPTNPYHRQYEALRAIFVEGQAPEAVAAQFGLAHRSLRQLLYQFRRHCRDGAAGSPFFASGKTGRPRARRHRARGRPTRRSPPSPIDAPSFSP